MSSKVDQPSIVHNSVDFQPHEAEEGELRLHASYRGSRYRLKSAEKDTETTKLAKEILGEAKKVVKEKKGAGMTRVKFSIEPNLRCGERRDVVGISYYNPQTKGRETIYEKDVDPDLVTKMQEFRKKIRPAWPSGEQFVKSVEMTPPLKFPHPDYISRSCMSFLRDHLKSLKTELSSKDNKEVERKVIQNVLASEALIQSFTRALKKKLAEKELEFKKLPLSDESYEAKKTDLELMKQMLNKLENKEGELLNRDAIFIAMSFWDNFNTGKMTNEVLAEFGKKGPLVAKYGEKHLQEFMERDKNSHRIREFLLPMWTKLFSYTPVELEEVPAPAGDIRDLLHENRFAIGPLEQLIVNMAMQIQNDDYKLNPHHRTLIQLSDSAREEFAQLAPGIFAKPQEALSKLNRLEFSTLHGLLRISDHDKGPLLTSLTFEPTVYDKLPPTALASFHK